MNIQDYLRITCPYCEENLATISKKGLTVRMKGIRFPMESYYALHPFIICKCGESFPLPIDFGQPQDTELV
ncbi:hypothetical protein [uncultured Desulfosarcina sp.]|uniref:hypothetical protein n=1 Tax=uncultured Desulfosarcina sp. TaxID=218289 RepID=UPI0029C689DC|nr:hypothetical protein [uncultured Desulfosarcina sp.]